MPILKHFAHAVYFLLHGHGTVSSGPAMGWSISIQPGVVTGIQLSGKACNLHEPVSLSVAILVPNIP